MAQHIWHLAEHIYYSRPILSYINPIQNCSIHLESSIYARVVDSKNSRTFVCHFLLYSEVSNSLTSDKPAMTKSTSYWKLNCFQLRYKLKLWIGQWSVHRWKLKSTKFQTSSMHGKRISTVCAVLCNALSIKRKRKLHYKERNTLQCMVLPAFREFNKNIALHSLDFSDENIINKQTAVRE